MADDIVSRLKKREVRRLPTNWQKGRLCPNCGSPADRPRCLWDLGGQCPRDEPRARSLQNTGVFRNSHTPEHANIEAGMLVVLFPRVSGDALRL